MRILTILITLGATALSFIGCGGSASVTVINNTSSYVEGDFDGHDGFGLSPNGQTRRSVDVGSFWNTSSDVDIHVRYHETYSSSSRVISRKTFHKELCSGESYTFELYTNSLGACEATWHAVGGGSGIVAP